MFEIEARGGLGRRGTWTRSGRTLSTPLVLFLHRSGRPAPNYAEALFVSERSEDPRFQVRVSGSFFAPRIGNHADDLPPVNGMPLSMADLEVPEDGVTGELSILVGESDLTRASRADAVFLANGPEFERSPREFVAAMRRLRESLGPAKVAAVTGLASPSNVSILVYAGVDVVDSSRMMLDSARGLFHTSDGVVPMSEADRAACGCPACTTGGDLEAHNDHALHREVLLVRNHLAHGQLRELVERRLANAPWNTAVVRHLDLREYDWVEPYTAVAGGAMLAYSLEYGSGIGSRRPRASYSSSPVPRASPTRRAAATVGSATRSSRLRTRPSSTRSSSPLPWDSSRGSWSAFTPRGIMTSP